MTLAPTADGTDWPQILALYGVLSQVAPGLVVTLSRAVALGMVHRPKGVFKRCPIWGNSTDMGNPGPTRTLRT